MAVPLRPEDLSENRFLTGLSIDYGAELDKVENYIGPVLFPDFPQDELIGTIFEWDKKSTYAINEGLLAYRRPSSLSARADFGSATPGTFALKDFSQHTGEPVVNIDQARRIGVDLQVRKTRLLTRLHRLLREYRKAQILTDPAIITQTTALAGANRIDAGGNFFTTLEAGVNAIYNTAGVVPNYMGMDEKVKNAIRNNSNYIDRFKYVINALPGMDLAPDIAGMKPLVSRVRADLTSKGQAISLTSVWGPNLILGYIPPIIDKDILIGAVAVVLRTLNQAIFDWFDPGTRSYLIEISTWDDLKYPVVACFYLVQTAIS